MNQGVADYIMVSDHAWVHIPPTGKGFLLAESQPIIVDLSVRYFRLDYIWK